MELYRMYDSNFFHIDFYFFRFFSSNRTIPAQFTHIPNNNQNHLHGAKDVTNFI
jgi:hypothetical protein